jgi:hypothetical protein
MSGSIQFLKQNGFAEFFAFSKSAIDPLLRRFDYTMDMWIVVDMFLFFAALIAGITDSTIIKVRNRVKW